MKSRRILSVILSTALLSGATSVSVFAKEPERKYDYVAIGDSIAAGFGMHGDGSQSSLVNDPALMLTEDLIANPVKEAYAQVFGDYLAELGKANDYTTTATNLASVAYRAQDVEQTILTEGYKGVVAEWIFESFLGQGASEPLAKYHDIYNKYLKEAELVSIQLGGNDIVMGILTPMRESQNPILISIATSLMLTLFGNDATTALGGGIQVLINNKDDVNYRTVTEAVSFLSNIANNSEMYVQNSADQVENVIRAVKTVNSTADIAVISMFNPYGNSIVYDDQVRDMSNIIKNILTRAAEEVCGQKLNIDDVELLSESQLAKKSRNCVKNINKLERFSSAIKKDSAYIKTQYKKLVSVVLDEIAYPLQYMTVGKNVEPQMLSLNKKLKVIANRTGAVYVDVYNISNECNMDPHPTAEGHKEIADIMKTTLSANILKSMTGEAAPNATKVKLNTNSVTLVKGRKYQLKATVLPTGASQAVTWTSSNKKVATVDKNGKITGIKSGTAVITATTPNGKKVYCRVTVKNTTLGAVLSMMKS